MLFSLKLKYTDFNTLANKNDNQTAEVKRRVGLGWAAFRKFRLIFKSKMNNSLKRKVFDSCVLIVLTYGAETITLTKTSENKLRVTPRAMERSMLGISLRDKMTNQCHSIR